MFRGIFGGRRAAAFLILFLTAGHLMDNNTVLAVLRCEGYEVEQPLLGDPSTSNLTELLCWLGSNSGVCVGRGETPPQGCLGPRVGCILRGSRVTLTAGPAGLGEMTTECSWHWAQLVSPCVWGCVRCGLGDWALGAAETTLAFSSAALRADKKVKGRWLHCPGGPWRGD